jgi:hypothetical protein
VPTCELVVAVSSPSICAGTVMSWWVTFLPISLPTTSLGYVVAQYDDTPVQFQGSPCGIYGRESGNEQVSFEVLRF